MDAKSWYLLGLIHGGGPLSKQVLERIDGRCMDDLMQDAYLEAKYARKAGPATKALLKSIQVKLLEDGAAESVIQSIESDESERLKWIEQAVSVFRKYERKRDGLLSRYGHGQTDKGCGSKVADER